MKSCPTCSTTYSERIDFCFLDGSVLVMETSELDAPLPGAFLDGVRSGLEFDRSRSVPGFLQAPPLAMWDGPSIPPVGMGPMHTGPLAFAPPPMTRAPFLDDEFTAADLETERTPPPRVDPDGFPVSDPTPPTPVPLELSSGTPDIDMRASPLPVGALARVGGEDRFVVEDRERRRRNAWMLVAALLFVVGAGSAFLTMVLSPQPGTGGEAAVQVAVAPKPAADAAGAAGGVEPSVDAGDIQFAPSEGQVEPVRPLAGAPAVAPGAAAAVAAAPAVAVASEPPAAPAPVKPAPSQGNQPPSPWGTVPGNPGGTAQANDNPWGAPQAEAVANVRVTSTPAGASVRVDGQGRGATPADVRLPYGTYKVELSLDGYESVSRVLDVNSERPVIPFELRAVPRTGKVMVFFGGRDGDVVFIDGLRAGTLPAQVTVTEGPHLFQVQGPQGDFQARRTVQVKPGGVSTLHLDRE